MLIGRLQHYRFYSSAHLQSQAFFNGQYNFLKVFNWCTFTHTLIQRRHSSNRFIHFTLDSVGKSVSAMGVAYNTMRFFGLNLSTLFYVLFNLFELCILLKRDFELISWSYMHMLTVKCVNKLHYKTIKVIIRLINNHTFSTVEILQKNINVEVEKHDVL